MVALRRLYCGPTQMAPFPLLRWLFAPFRSGGCIAYLASLRKRKRCKELKGPHAWALCFAPWQA